MGKNNLPPLPKTAEVPPAKWSITHNLRGIAKWHWRHFEEWDYATSQVSMTGMPEDRLSLPTIDDLDECLRVYDFRFAITWLKVNVSVEFAKDVERTLIRPLKYLRRLNERAREDCGEAPPEDRWERVVLWERRNWLLQAVANNVLRGQWGYTHYIHKFLTMLEHSIFELQNVIVVLEEKFDGLPIGADNIPTPPEQRQVAVELLDPTRAMTIIEAGCIYEGIDPKPSTNEEHERQRDNARNTFKTAMRDIPHRPVGSKWQFEKSYFPPAAQHLL